MEKQITPQRHQGHEGAPRKEQEKDKEAFLGDSFVPSSLGGGIPDNGLLRFITCGSVDDGKSTLIGRLLYDSKAILADAMDALAKSSRKRGLEEVDLSLLTDGLSAEREQGITIDVAYRYFSTGTRKYILADAPGHEQYTRNMVTGASTADLAIVLIDARKGVLPQTRRHTTLAHLMGLRHIVVAVNKMDLVDYNQAVFSTIQAQVGAFASKLGIPQLHFIPLSALKGDMVVDRGERLDWYQGPTLMELLESIELDSSEQDQPFRFPVQLVCRPRTEELIDYRGYQGRVESGRIKPGDAITVQPSGARSRVRRIELYGKELPEAVAGQSVTLLLEDEVDISRGDLIASAEHAPVPTRSLTATLAWLGEKPLSSTGRLVLRHGTREVRAKVGEIESRLDLEALEPVPVEDVAMNDIVTVTLKLQGPIAPDAHTVLRSGGSFILIDEATHNTVAAGLVLGPEYL
ncbi:GTP-binding protein [Holophaga foetida]|uniref:sulfate adenylyltransferase subunit 1 n=1 Tax=Holophaga foetida TaxID=35839 RepID=UPI0002474CE3